MQPRKSLEGSTIEGRVKCLGHVEVFWEGPRSHHAFPVISVESLEFRTPMRVSVWGFVSYCIDIPILEPDLNLSWAKSWNFLGESLPLGCIWMSLSGKLAHKISCLLMGKSLTEVSSQGQETS